MGQINFSISIAHLYPDLLNIYGDLGNITAFKNRCLWRNIDVKIDEIKSKDKIDYKKYDFYFIGGGQDTQQIAASAELLYNKDSLIEAMENNSVFFGICGGYQLLGKYYQPKNAERIDGIGLLDAYTIAGDKRLIGNAKGVCSFLDNTTVVGFENHSGLTFLNGDTIPFLKTVKGYGNNGKDKSEGARYKNVFGTYLHGPVLPKNPKFADYLIHLALKKRYGGNIPLDELNDEIEEKTLNYCAKFAK